MVPRHENLEEVMSRVADFCANPLLNSTNAQREKFAVDSEYKNGLIEGIGMEYRVLSLLSNPGHPMHYLHVGNA